MSVRDDEYLSLIGTRLTDEDQLSKDVIATLDNASSSGDQEAVPESFVRQLHYLRPQNPVPFFECVSHEYPQLAASPRKPTHVSEPVPPSTETVLVSGDDGRPLGEEEAISPQTPTSHAAAAPVPQLATSLSGPIDKDVPVGILPTLPTAKLKAEAPHIDDATAAYFDSVRAHLASRRFTNKDPQPQDAAAEAGAPEPSLRNRAPLRASVTAAAASSDHATKSSSGSGPQIVNLHFGPHRLEPKTERGETGNDYKAANARREALSAGPDAVALDVESLPLLARTLHEPEIKVLNYRKNVLPVLPLLPPGVIAVNPYDNTSARIQQLRWEAEERVRRDGLPKCTCGSRKEVSAAAGVTETALEADARGVDAAETQVKETPVADGSTALRESGHAANLDADDDALSPRVDEGQSAPSDDAAATLRAPGRGSVVGRAIARLCQCGDVPVHRARLFKDIIAADGDNPDLFGGTSAEETIEAATAGGVANIPDFEGPQDIGITQSAGHLGSATLFSETTTYYADGRVGAGSRPVSVRQDGMGLPLLPPGVGRWGRNSLGMNTSSGTNIPARATDVTGTDKLGNFVPSEGNATADPAHALSAEAGETLPYCVEHRTARVTLRPQLSLRSPLQSLRSLGAVAMGAVVYALFYPMMALWSGTIVHNILFGHVLFVTAATALYTAYSYGSYTAAALIFALCFHYIRGLRDIEKFKDPLRPSVWRAFQSHWVWRLCHHWGYFQAMRLAKLNPAKQYLFAFYPHGILIHSKLVLWGGTFHSLFPALRIPLMLAARVLFSVPGSRECCDWLGAVDAGRKTAERCMASGVNVAVYPGGTAEILTTDANDARTTLLVRSGFIRLAIRHGVPVVPVLAIGEKYMYTRVRIPSWIAKLVYRKIKAPLIWFYGKYYSWLPDRRPNTVIFGKPIPVRKNENPSDAEVEEALVEYLQQCVDIFHTFKGNLGYGPEQTLNIVDANSYTHVRPVDCDG